MPEANAFDWLNYTDQERARKGIKNPYKDLHMSHINSHTGASDRLKPLILPGTKVDLRPKQFIVYSKARRSK